MKRKDFFEISLASLDCLWYTLIGISAYTCVVVFLDSVGYNIGFVVKSVGYFILFYPVFKFFLYICAKTNVSNDEIDYGW